MITSTVMRYITQTRTLAVGELVQFDADEVLYLVAASAPVTLVATADQIMGGTGSVLPERCALRGTVVDGQRRRIGVIGLRNDATAPNTITLATTNGDFFDGRLSIPTGAILPVQGVDAAGQPVTAKPVLAAGTDGTTARTLKTDTAGRVVITGEDTNWPICVGGSDGSARRTLKTDNHGRPMVAGAEAAGALLTAAPVATGVRVCSAGAPGSSVTTDGAVQTAAGDSEGRAIVQLFASSGRRSAYRRVVTTAGDYTIGNPLNAGERHYLISLALASTDTVARVVEVKCGSTLQLSFVVPPNGTVVWAPVVPLTSAEQQPFSVSIASLSAGATIYASSQYISNA